MKQSDIQINSQNCNSRQIADAVVGAISNGVSHLQGIHLPQPCMGVVNSAQLQRIWNLQVVQKLQQKQAELNKLMERRNDINHAGFRHNRVSARQLRDDLKDLYEALKGI